MNGPRTTSAFLVLTAIAFAGLLGALAWRATTAGAAAWLLAVGLVVALFALVIGVAFARGVAEGRL